MIEVSTTSTNIAIASSSASLPLNGTGWGTSDAMTHREHPSAVPQTMRSG